MELTNNKTMLDQQKAEALERMKMLKIMGNVCNEFRRSNRVYYSERQTSIFDGILYWLDNNDDYVKIVRDFEDKNGYLVYHAQLTHTGFGDLLSLLYVSNRPNEWEEDKLMLKSGDAVSYVYNLIDPQLSETGLIGVAPRNGGITRTY